MLIEYLVWKTGTWKYLHTQDRKDVRSLIFSQFYYDFIMFEEPKYNYFVFCDGEVIETHAGSKKITSIMS